MQNFQIAIVVHGGAGSTPAIQDGCIKAAEEGFALLKEGRQAVEAAVRAVQTMEDDGRFNAGLGSYLRLDGKSVQMDASVMDSRGNLGAVMAISKVKNPILVALEVTKTPHVFLAGEGATAFARRRGFKHFYHVTQRAKNWHERLVQSLRQGEGPYITDQWKKMDLKEMWNFPDSIKKVIGSSDTVGAVARDREGHFAVASSTGGSTPMLKGRVGDTPVIGCGFFAGPDGAVALTGIGEEIIRRMPARAAYDLIASGLPAQEASGQVVEKFPREISVGIIAVSREGYGIATNRAMASHAIVEQG